jgi:hypothetical protein
MATGFRKLAIAGLLTLLAIGGGARADEDGPAGRLERALQLASLKIHDRWLDPDEVRAAADAFATQPDPRAVYRSFLDGWLDRDVYRNIARRMALGRARARSLFVDQLRVAQSEDHHAVYYLPHQTGAVQPGQPPCSADDQVRVTPWWSVDTTIAICATSYRPDQVFDDVGYCGGQPEPVVPLPPRSTCGCGPLLLGCLPAEEDWPGLADAFDRDIRAESIETVATMIADGAAYREIVTTSRTWQTGLGRFLYLRRQLIGELAGKPFTTAAMLSMIARIRAIDLQAPGAMLDRPPVYAGTGLLFGLQNGAQDPHYRTIVLGVLDRELCSPGFDSVHVTSDVLLLTTSKEPNLRLKEVHNSPMRTQEGCKGCHGPMDNTAGFLTAIATPLYGSIATGRSNHATLMVNGPADARQTGVGPRGLLELVTAQPEFEPCQARRFFTYFVDRPPTERELALLERSARTKDRSMQQLLRAILLSDEFTHGLLVPTGAPSLVPDRLAAAPARADRALVRVQRRIDEVCSGCHGASNTQIDLESPLVLGDSRLGKIFDAVSNYRMPPSATGEVTTSADVEQRFGMPQDDRATLRRDLELLLTDSDPIPATSLMLNGQQRLAVMQAVARRWLPQAEIDEVIQPLLSNGHAYLVAQVLPQGEMVETKLRLMARGLCRRSMHRTEGGFSVAPSGSPDAIARLLASIYGRAPTSLELLDAVDAQERLAAHVTPPDTPLVALCTTHLSGPRLAVLPFAAAPAAGVAASRGGSR